MTEIQYDTDIPPEVRDALQPLFEKWAWLVPGWCYMLRVGYEGTFPGEEDAFAANRTMAEYREARISVAGGWLGRTDDERENGIVHELIHILLATMRGVMFDALEGAGDEKFRIFAEEQWRMAMEGAVCDLTHALMNNG